MNNASYSYDYSTDVYTARDSFKTAGETVRVMCSKQGITVNQALDQLHEASKLSPSLARCAIHPDTGKIVFVKYGSRALMEAKK